MNSQWGELSPCPALSAGALTCEQASSSFMIYESKISRLRATRSSSVSSFSYFLIWGQCSQVTSGPQQALRAPVPARRHLPAPPNCPLLTSS